MESDLKYSHSQKPPFSPRVGFDCKIQIIAPPAPPCLYLPLPSRAATGRTQDVESVRRVCSLSLPLAQRFDVLGKIPACPIIGAFPIPPMRIDARNLSGYFTTLDVIAFRALAASQEKDVQELLGEAINTIFECYGLPNRILITSGRRTRRGR